MLETLLGSKVRARLLEWLYTHPDQRFYVRQLESLLGLDSTNISRELIKLLKLGIVTLTASGNQKHYSVNQESPVYEDLRNIVIKLGVASSILRQALDPLLDRVRIAFIYGSFALGEQGAGSDLDLMVIGDVTLKDLAPLLRESMRILGREINAACYTPYEYAHIQNQPGFLSRVTAGEKLFVIGDEDDLAVLVQG